MSERTDPWRWYCRVCGERGEHNAVEGRDANAASHVLEEHWRTGDVMGWSGSGRLAHVWCYSRQYN